MRLFNRTSRSVTLTSAGRELRAALAGPFDAIDTAVEALNRYRAEPAGRIRLNMLEHASLLLLAPVLPVFVERYPYRGRCRRLKSLDRCGRARRRRGHTLWRHGAALGRHPLGGGGIAWLFRSSRRALPSERLHAHQCLRIRRGDDSIYRLELEKNGEEFAVDVPVAITIDETQFALSLVKAGTAIAYLPEPSVAAQISQGLLRSVLDDWAPMGPGFHIYYPGRRQLPIGLRLLIELIREMQPLRLTYRAAAPLCVFSSFPYLTMGCV
ncbi:LysR substrate-binding domain-containing protein [Bradyrhizobium ottawaense]|uniref:LysR substrate-binding domain-containing protein n=1 Tax=Bradyrhizobium ottawaense TaxID=931866 RepID=UPI003FA10622